jgi:hypothetical protein
MRTPTPPRAAHGRCGRRRSTWHDWVNGGLAWLGQVIRQIAAGVQLFYLSRIMGRSVAQIDQTYGHLVPDSEEYLRGLLDSFDTLSRSGMRQSESVSS